MCISKFIVIIIIIISQELRQEITSMWWMKKVDVVPVVVGVLGVAKPKIREWLCKLEIKVRVEQLQKSALLGTARILRRHMNAYYNVF